MSGTRSKLAVLALAAFCALVSFPASAQLTAEDYAAIEQLRTQIKADRQAIVAENVKLTEAEAQKFWPVYREYRTALDKVGDRRVKLITDYATNYDVMTDEKATEFFKEYISIEKETLKLKEQYSEKIRKIVSGKTAARYFQIENKLDAVMQVALAIEIPLVK